tara:strand:- start:1052 stop:1336 length:285 start_codon:yes stop_codon:yes gene_type:complete
MIHKDLAKVYAKRLAADLDRGTLIDIAIHHMIMEFQSFSEQELLEEIDETGEYPELTEKAQINATIAKWHNNDIDIIDTHNPNNSRPKDNKWAR